MQSQDFSGDSFTFILLVLLFCDLSLEHKFYRMLYSKKKFHCSAHMGNAAFDTQLKIYSVC